MTQITPCLWFDTQAEEAARFYTSVFKNSRIINTSYYSEVGPRPAGTVLEVSFELDGQPFMALNGGPEFTFSEAVSFIVDCHGQEEVDYYWDRLLEGGEESMCGWLKDKFGVSWQIVPSELGEMMSSTDAGKARRVTEALLQMRKLDIAELRRAYEAG